MVVSSRQGRLFRKYMALFSALVCLALLGSGAVEAWFRYRSETAALLRFQQEQADAAAGEIGQFLAEIERHLGWMTLLPWTQANLDQRRLDAERLLRQVPAVTEVVQIDPRGREQIRISRLAANLYGRDIDRSAEPIFAEALARGVHRGPIHFRASSEPYMTISAAGTHRAAGVSAVEVNLKLIWDIVVGLKIGQNGLAYVVDQRGRLIAHPEISLVLRNSDMAGLAHVAMALTRDALATRSRISVDLLGQPVLAAFAPISPLGWTMVVEMPLEEAYAPLYDSFKRMGVLLLVGLILSALAGLVLARRMIVPIRALQQGAAQVGRGEFGAQVRVRTGDELETLAEDFNAMSRDLKDSRERAERAGRLRRFLTPQLAQVLETTGGEELLKSHRSEVVVVFCDLRGFTAFAEATAPEEVMRVLDDYHAGLGALVAKFEGTLERFVGDGMMVLFNDPLPCPDAAERAATMALAMRGCVAELGRSWRDRGHELGFGIGIAQGFATLGQIGFEGRRDYSAIGTVPNLAARLCGEAGDGQILIDSVMRQAIADKAELEDIGELTLKGLRRAVRAWNLAAMREVSDRKI